MKLESYRSCSYDRIYNITFGPFTGKPLIYMSCSIVYEKVYSEYLNLSIATNMNTLIIKKK